MNGDTPDQPPGNEGEEPKTVFIPAGGSLPPREQTPPPPAEPYSAPPTSFPPTGTTSIEANVTSFAPRTDGKGIQVGDVLNHIFEVKRFIARGGMGEVFEGSNVNSDERVAIKVMLPALAADPNVISMFRKEARTLTKLQHEALVQYRVLAQEPQLGVLYIVTEYIDGSNLADVLGQVAPTPAELTALLRRLASGLRAAHQLGAIHRDISPDNVLLEDGKLARAKIIDFGIAKDLDPGTATIVGDGFAGKLNYVAPEQLGDFGRTIGPWTDVYSLALVILAISLGRNVQMGGSLVDAVDKRRAGVDISGAPEEIRPVLELMLKPNPADRLASMDAVLDELTRSAAPPAPPPVPESGGPNKGLLIGGGVAALAIAGAAGWFLLSGKPAATGGAGAGGTAAQQVAENRDPIEVARSVIDATLPSVSCTWLSIVDIAKSDRGPLVKLTGVAGNPSAAQTEISRALAQQKIEGANIDFEEVSPITQSGCAALDTYRQIRAPTTSRLTTPQRKFEMRMQPNDPSQSGYPGENAATVVMNINVADPKADFALVGVEPSGVIDGEFLGPDAGVIGRPQLQKFAKDMPRLVTDQGGDKYRMQLDVNHAGWSGVLLLTGKGPFPKDLIGPQLGARGPDWTNKFVSTAAAQGWQAEMVWFKTVDEVKE
ncbi:serine/threonine-protein kinase [Sphingomonas immobilis]|uniref:Serine/threonine-protein kinase n=1 Tax=Sphingomonas immobilis TaxID=3063997 RepID=A0ABT9A1V9_9SPHN|nr:serine/threonine-protein kinase [Sphingomonas sp. CA1-15]MDO7843821.1 serine/threonine-protein kinase [Sphingomonas sp. CA1-15]